MVEVLVQQDMMITERCQMAICGQVVRYTVVPATYNICSKQSRENRGGVLKTVEEFRPIVWKS